MESRQVNFLEEDRPSSAEGVDKWWQLPVSLRPGSTQSNESYLTPEPNHDCILLGPSGTGKSSVLSSLSRTCQGDLRGDLSISLVPGASLAALTGNTARFLASESTGFEPTRTPISYDLQVTLRGRSESKGRSFQMLVQDLPGQDLFDSNPSPQVHGWLQDARTASCLVLCVHSMNPERPLWESSLPRIIEALMVSSGDLVPRLGRIARPDLPPMQRPDLPPMQSPKKQLPFEKILVLLTQIDRLCGAAAEALLSEHLPNTGRVAPVLNRLARNPDELARHLDPVQLVRDHLGAPLLGYLRSACRPGARFAVGLTSAWGFNSPGAGIGYGKSNLSSRIDRWRPFGLWEALLFLTTSEARHPVEFLPLDTPVDPDHRFLSPRSFRSKVLELGGR